MPTASRIGNGRTSLPGANKIWRALPEGRVARDWYAWRGKGAPHIARFEGATRAAIIAQENSVDGAKVIAEGYARAMRPAIDIRNFGGILDAWEASSAFRDRAESTKRNERSALKHIRADADFLTTPSKFLDAKNIKGVRRRVRGWLETVSASNGPRAADTRRDIISKAINWGIGEEYCSANPAEGIEDFAYADRSDIIWLNEELQAIEAAARAERRKRLKEGAPEPLEPPAPVLALLLACYSGLRREDLCRLNDAALSDAAIMLKPLKSQRRARTAKKRAPADIVIPRTPELNAVLAMCKQIRERWEKRDKVKRAHILLNSRGMAWTPTGLTSSFIKIRDIAGIEHVYDDGREPAPKTLHDARGTFVTHMRCCGYSKEEVGEMVGWETEDVERVSKRYADADRIALAWLERLKRAAG